jgi:hypothetical protein
VLQWLIEGAEQLRAFSAYFLCDLHLEQLQLDELYAVLRDLKAGAISDDEAIRRLERSPPGCGRRWTPRASSYWWSMSAAAPWRWRSASCTR